MTNKTGSESVSIDLNSGQIQLDATVTNGTIVCRGIGKLTDNSVGATVVNELIHTSYIADAVWDEDLSTHSPEDSAASILKYLRSLVGGRWHIVGDQMIFYEDDNVTEVARFDLKDAGGLPAMANVFQRTYVP